MLTDDDVNLTARYAAYERIMEYLLTHHLCKYADRDWEEIRASIIGPGAKLTSGLISTDDLQRIDAAITERISAIFDRSADWAAQALEQDQ